MPERQINIGVIRTVGDFLPFLCNSIFLVSYNLLSNISVCIFISDPFRGHNIYFGNEFHNFCLSIWLFHTFLCMARKNKFYIYLRRRKNLFVFFCLLFFFFVIFYFIVWDVRVMVFMPKLLRFFQWGKLWDFEVILCLFMLIFVLGGGNTSNSLVSHNIPTNHTIYFIFKIQP